MPDVIGVTNAIDAVDSVGAVSVARTWSDEQSAIFEYFAQGLPHGHTLIEAYAGTGKSTTLVEAIRRYFDVYPRARVLLCAYNARARDDLVEKSNKYTWPTTAAFDIRTLHQVGWRLCMRGLRGIKMDRSKAYRVTRAVLIEQKVTTPTNDRSRPPSADRVWVDRVVALAALAKNTMANSVEDLEKLIEKHVIIPKPVELSSFSVDMRNSLRTNYEAAIKRLVELTPRVLEAMMQDAKTADFDDQLWLPSRYAIEPGFRFDLVVVDEVNDMNRAQLWLADRMLDDNGRLVLCGDRNQAVYNFRGADSASFAAIADSRQWATFKLSTTYRCAKLIVKEAQTFVSDFQAAPNAPDGIVADASVNEMIQIATEGDFILSRVNAPLASIYIRLLVVGKRAVMAGGRDVSNNLIELIENSRARTLTDLAVWLEAYRERQESAFKNIDQDAEDTQSEKDAISEALDTARVLSALMRRQRSIEGLRAEIDRLFVNLDDIDPKSRIVCSTIHAAKGREANRVFLLEDTLKGDTEEEKHICYVAITRAMRELVYVRGETEASPVVVTSIDDERAEVEADISFRRAMREREVASTSPLVSPLPSPPRLGTQPRKKGYYDIE